MSEFLSGLSVGLGDNTVWENTGFDNPLVKLAYGSEGHQLLTKEVAAGMGAGDASGRILGEYASTIADAHGSSGTGVMADKARQMRASGGRMNRIGAKALEIGAKAGSALDKPVRHPYSPLAQKRHAFPGTLDQAREVIRTGRADAGNMLAQASLAQGGERGRLFTQALGHAGESGHVAQDVKPHTVEAGRFFNEAAEGLHGKKSQYAAGAAKRMPKSLMPMAVSGVGHMASGLEGQSAALDDTALISQREMRGAAKHGKKVRMSAIEALRYEHNIPTQQAVNMIDELLKSSPSALQEIGGKASHRMKSYGDLAKGLGRILFRK